MATAGSKTGNVSKLLICIVACEAAGLIGAVFTAGAIPTWYAALQKPSFTPPNWLFGPAWTTLYLLMGIAAFAAWRKGLADQRVKASLSSFLGQLILNVLWTATFFGLKSLFGGVLVIAGLWIAILITMLKFFGISKAAGVLMVPYILWVTFAAALTVSVWMLNPPPPG